MADDIFVGREHELARLRASLDRALAGQSQICFVVGQAGSGKTALVAHFVQQALAADPDLVVALGSCNAQTGIGDPYLPFREALAMLTGSAPEKQTVGSIAGQNVGRLRMVLVRSVQILVEVAPDLVGLFVPGAKLAGVVGKALANKMGWMDRLEDLTNKGEGAAPEQSRIFEQYTAFVKRLSARVPLILFLDDLQWADNASLSLLFHLGRRLESSRVLLVGAYRPSDVALGREGERHPLEPVVNELRRYYGDIVLDLDQISPETSRRFVDAVLDSELNCFEDAFREALFYRTGGHALFTVELLRALEERGELVRDDEGCWVPSPALDWDALPARVEGVIEERIDRLDEDLKETLTVGSVEGEAFTAEVVARVQALSERDAIRQLSAELERQHRLVSAEGLVRLGNLRLSLYRFVHNLFQQYLYGNLDEAERIYLHRDVGCAIEALFEGQTEEVAAQLARHFEEAGVPDKAAAYRLQAGTKALRMSAHREAIFHLGSGLDLLADLSSGPERMQLEWTLQNSLGVASLATYGYASSQAQQAFSRARELAQALEDPAREIPVLYGLATFRFVRGDLNQAYEEGQQLLDLTRQANQAGYMLGSQLVLGAVALNLGKLDRARAYLEAATEQYDLDQHRDLAHSLGQDPAVGSFAFLSFVLWHLGYPEQAIAAKDAALRLATELDHPYSHGFAASFAAMLLQMLRLREECEAQSAIALQISKGHYPMWESIARFTHGWSITYRGQIEEGLREVKQGVDLWESTGAHLAFPYRCALLADACLAAGQRAEGLQAIERSFTYPEEVWWLAEQHRLRAELLLLEPGAEGETEASLRKALSIARDQGSRAFELRAALSLARLLRAQGRVAEARAPLAECYAWFTEGLDLPDLRDAREFLT